MTDVLVEQGKILGPIGQPVSTIFLELCNRMKAHFKESCKIVGQKELKNVTALKYEGFPTKNWLLSLFLLFLYLYYTASYKSPFPCIFR